MLNEAEIRAKGWSLLEVSLLREDWGMGKGEELFDERFC